MDARRRAVNVPYPEFLELPIAKLCEGKPRDALLFGGGLDYLQRPRASGKSRSWFASIAKARGSPPIQGRCLCPCCSRRTISAIRIGL